ncbi:(S)-mandelate dehydrogenase [Variovorax sp. PBS-H4]|uniref:alpha-hydroxy acid oxidase n=1 Tax=Variovorax sp. PBS-H4 TaxID=434008 RepID=UPI001316D2BD|nr:alpha-hydroxy acid oxidase [Variovorax sp. PBS-H4]VTU40255.1 (S)-mandelate dehydrogenase [Variovorax sp. PBS-H4]
MRRSLETALSIADLRSLARRTLPRFLYDYLDGGVEDETGLNRNVDAFAQHAFVPRYLRDVEEARGTTKLFGRTYEQPFGIAPTGFAGLLRPGADLMLARAAAGRGIPFILSGVSNTSLEDACHHGLRQTWLQLYPSKDKSIALDVIDRAARVGIDHLVVTVDIPVGSKRERDLRNGFGLPWKHNSRATMEALLHPGWLLRFLNNGGLPFFEDWRPYAGRQASPMQVANFVRTQSPAQVTWTDIKEFRRRWGGKLILKGIMHPDDARQAVGHGVDGIIVSNHGGRQLDRAASSLTALRAVRAAVGSALPVMMDGGVRRGADVALALCFGASFVFVGRPTLYGVAAGGKKGATKAIDILADELLRVLRQVGVREVGELDTSLLLASSRPEVGLLPS